MFDCLLILPCPNKGAQPSGVTIHLEDPFPLTPTLSPGERETVAGAGNSSRSCEYSQMAESYSLSSGERVGVRGNSISNCIDTASGCSSFPLLLWRRGAGRGGRSSHPARQICWGGSPLECCQEPQHRQWASSPQPSPPKEERENPSQRVMGPSNDSR